MGGGWQVSGCQDDDNSVPGPQVCVSRLGLPVLATASADQTARVWGLHSGACLLQYHGHQGSVNSVRWVGEGGGRFRCDMMVVPGSTPARSWC